MAQTELRNQNKILALKSGEVSGTRAVTKAPKVRKARAGTLIWAFDPYEKNKEDMQTMAQTLEAWPGAQKIIPVSVFTATGFGASVEGLPPILEGIYKTKSTASQEIKDQFEEGRIQNHQVLFEPATSRRAAVNRLMNFAKDKDAKAIFVHAHGRRGLERFRLGSFTEGLISLSPIPVFVVGPKCEPPSEISKILFATDFSPTSRRAFEKVLELAQDFESEVLIYHRAGSPVPPLAYTEYGIGMDPDWWDQFYDEQRAELSEKGTVYVKKARERGVKADYFIEYEEGLLSDRIIETAEKQHCDLLVMGIHRGPVNQTIFGGDLRDILAESRQPVVIVHSK